MKNLKTIALVSLMNFTLLFGAVWFSSYQNSSPKSDTRFSEDQSDNGQNAAILNPLPDQQGKKNTTPTLTTSSEASKPQSNQTPLSTPAQQPSVPPPAADNRCLITVQGKRYDVTEFRASHPGGNIFQCGADMTNIFFSQHNQEILNGKMSKFLVN